MEEQQVKSIQNPPKQQVIKSQPDGQSHHQPENQHQSVPLPQKNIDHQLIPVENQVIEEKKQENNQEKPKEVIISKQNRKDQKEISQMKNEVESITLSEKIEKDSVEQQNRFKIRIEVVNSEQKGSGLSKHMVYTIVGVDNHGAFEIQRKYTQFISLRKILYERWPGCYIPSITNKTEIKKFEEKQRHIRNILTNFLIGLSYSDHLYYKEEMQLFLRCFGVDICEMFEKMPVLKTPDVIGRFRTCFGSQVQGVSMPNNANIISTFTTSLKKIIHNLGTLSEKALTLSESYDFYSQTVSKFGQYIRVYEQLSLSQFTNNQREKTIFIKDQENRIEKLKELCKLNPFYKLYSFLQNQVRDAQAFLEVVIAIELFTMKRDQLELKIKEIQLEIDQLSIGHKTMRSMTTRKSKEQILKQLQDLQKKLIEEKHTITEIFKIIEIVLANKEIKVFKQVKKDNYQNILKEWITFIGEINPDLESIWRFVNQQTKELKKHIDQVGGEKQKQLNSETKEEINQKSQKQEIKKEEIKNEQIKKEEELKKDEEKQ